MAQRNFHNYKLNQASSVPWSPEEAIALGYARWMDEHGCTECTTPGPKVRFTENNICVGCLLKLSNEFFPLWEMGHPDRPEPWSTSPKRSSELGIDYYYAGQGRSVICTNGPHVRKTHIPTGKCLACAEAKHRLASPRSIARAAGLPTYIPASECPQCHTKAERNVINNACSGCKVKSPRAIARAAGYSTYIPLDDCPECHTKSPRNVVNNACSGCKTDARTTQSRQFAASNPDMIVDKVTAKAIGLSLYRTGKPCAKGHTGWRYISTNNCIECRS